MCTWHCVRVTINSSADLNLEVNTCILTFSRLKSASLTSLGLDSLIHLEYYSINKHVLSLYSKAGHITGVT